MAVAHDCLEFPRMHVESSNCCDKAYGKVPAEKRGCCSIVVAGKAQV